MRCTESEFELKKILPAKSRNCLSVHLHKFTTPTLHRKTIVYTLRL
jgi:hypothetical protein